MLDERKTTALLDAVKAERGPVVEWLVERGADPQAKILVAGSTYATAAKASRGAMGDLLLRLAGVSELDRALAH